VVLKVHMLIFLNILVISLLVYVKVAQFACCLVVCYGLVCVCVYMHGVVVVS
jgi:hypothetical protein